MLMRKLLLDLVNAWWRIWGRSRGHGSAQRPRRRARGFEPLESRALLAGGDWLGADWQYRSPVTVHSTAPGASALTDFPLLVDSTQENWRSVAAGGRIVHPDGADFVFTLADGQTRLAHEIETYDPVTGHLTAWVRLPELALQHETTIYAYYGNIGAATLSSGSDVWTEYASVYHFSEDLVAAAATCNAQACDSTANGHHLSGAGMLGSDFVPGPIGNAVSFTRAGTGLYAENYVLAGSALTISVWLRATQSSAMGYPVSLPYSSVPGWNGFDIATDVGGVSAHSTTEAGFQSTARLFDYANAAYHHVAAAFDGTTVSLYLDGQLASVGAHDGTLCLSANELNVGYFSRHWPGYRFKGQLDEVRLAEVARAADWLRTEYLNQSSPGTMVQINPEEFNSAAWPTRVRVDIDNSGLDAALQDYQVLVDVPYRQGMRSDFADIRFVDLDGRVLDHWLEESVSATRARFWVKVPELPAEQQTFIDLYYGNPSAPSASDGSRTFVFFDDFNDNQLATARWSTGGHPEEYNGHLVLKDEFEYVQAWQPSLVGQAVRHRSWHQASRVTFVGWQENLQSGAGYYFGLSRRVTDAGSGVHAITQDHTGYVQDPLSQLYTNEWHVWETDWLVDQTVHRIVDAEESLAHTSHVATEPVKVTASTSGGKLLIDWLLVRQLVSVEPVATLGAEQPNPTAPPPLAPDAGEWTLVLQDDPAATDRWQPRDSAGQLVFDGAMWVLGGWTNHNGRLNDVWKSTDGVTWQLVTAEAPWDKRNLAGAAVHDGKMWIAGGISTTSSYSDVWSSSDGVHWTLVTEQAPWGPRGGLTMVSWQGQLLVMGGMDFATGAHYSDVWSSPDGVNWTQVASHAFPERSMHASVVYDDKIWVMGGGVYDTTAAFNTAVDYNDVWFSTDGTTWTAATSAAPWAERRFTCAAVHRDYLWLVGGFHFGNRNDVWVTQNGWDWTPVQEPTVFSDRHEPSCLSFAGSLWVMGGFDDERARNDVWVHP